MGRRTTMSLFEAVGWYFGIGCFAAFLVLVSDRLVEKHWGDFETFARLVFIWPVVPVVLVLRFLSDHGPHLRWGYTLTQRQEESAVERGWTFRAYGLSMRAWFVGAVRMERREG